MKYIAQYIKKLCPDVVITVSKTTESTYYQMNNNFSVRLSEHIGWYEKGKISVIKIFNDEDFIVLIETSPFPLKKTRKEVKELIKNLYEVSQVTTLSKEYYAAKAKAELESLTDWERFWSKVCQITSNARFLTNDQKTVIKKYFNKSIRGENMVNIVKKFKPTTPLEKINKTFEKLTE